MNRLSEYDLKQITLIEKKISLFEDNRLNLFNLICDLTGLLNALETVVHSWRDKFRIEINTLEIICDSLEDESISKWNGNYKEDILTAVSKLKKMTISIKEEYLKTSDPNVLEYAIATDANWLICPKCNDAWEPDFRMQWLYVPNVNVFFTTLIYNELYPQQLEFL